MLNQLNVDNIWYDYIVSESKTIEGRLCKDKFKLMNTGDTITFRNRNNLTINCKIIRITNYKTFEEYLTAKRMKKLYFFVHLLKVLKYIESIIHMLMSLIMAFYQLNLFIFNYLI